MGCASSKLDSEAREANARNAEIEDQLRRDKLRMGNEVKLLLLGAGESGKSTILKQMRLIHRGTYEEDEREAYRDVIFVNVLQSIKVILEAMKGMGVRLGDSQLNRKHAQFVANYQPAYADYMDPELTNAIDCLWKDTGVKKMYTRAREFQLNDSADYYLNNVKRIGSPGYIPNDQDILRSRVKTTGIVEACFQIGELTYRMFDVGGQRSERKKWIHCFENVTAIIFLVGMSEYDQTLYEDSSVNRMSEALNLFESISNSKWFTNSSIILFLNKIDIFRDKLQRSPVNKYFPDYTGPNDFESTIQYFGNRFTRLNGSSHKEIYVHLTCATETEQIRMVLNAVSDILINDNLQQCGLV